MFMIRRTVPGDEPRLLDVRLRALEDDPVAFGSTLEQERARSPESWSRWIAPGATFLVEPTDGDPQAMGIVAGYHDPADPSIVHLVSMWVAPARRSSGAAGALIEALVAWAAATGAREVRLRVVRDNARATRVYERDGFRPSGRTFVRERDGAIEVEMSRRIDPDDGRRSGKSVPP